MILLIVPLNVHAEETGMISVDVSESTYVDRDEVWANFGAVGHCFVGHQSEDYPGMPRYYTFVKFNLSAIPSGVAIESAYLQIFPGAARTVPPYYEISAYYCANNNWQELTLNYWNAPWDDVSYAPTDTTSWQSLYETVVLDVKSDVIKSLSVGVLTEVLSANPSVDAWIFPEARLNVTWLKISTGVTLSLSKISVAKSENLTVWGLLNPAVQAQMTLRYIKPDLTSFNATVTTGTDGRFQHTLIPDQIGTWQVTAIWNGTSKYSSCYSDTLSFTVTEPQTPPPSFGTDYVPIIIFGIIVAAIVILGTTGVWLWRRRRLKNLSGPR
jgi:hypothetical protein